MNASWFSTLGYGFPQHHLQKRLWKKVNNTPNIENKSWIIIGDLNELSYLRKSLVNVGNSS